MKNADVVIGGVYSAKVSGAVVPVKVIRAGSVSGWYARNLKTGRDVRIGSAQRFRVRFCGKCEQRQVASVGNNLCTDCLRAVGAL